MKLQLLKPSKSLNKAYLKQSVTLDQIELFKRELKNVFNHIDDNQDEEYHKNKISFFLLQVYYNEKHLVNVNKKQDLVIRKGNGKDDEVRVILEFKKPPKGSLKNTEMISETKPNAKALQELVLYYLRETTAEKANHEIRHLIATNIYEWYIFDGSLFKDKILKNAELKKDYKDWKATSLGTEHFYKHIAAKHIDLIEDEVPCTYFNFKDYEKLLDKTELTEKEEETIINLYKILSPQHLLTLPFANDSNTLNNEFYNELLYIIGLEERKDGSKKKIDRYNPQFRKEGSLIENTISVLKRKRLFWCNTEEETEYKYFETALELNITWLNRILFLKLLEGQLIKYNNDKVGKFSFLNSLKIKDFDELDELFFDVLAIPNKERSESIKKVLDDIPYLNSSLFELTELEKVHQGINQLKDRLTIPFYERTVLKDGKGKRISGEIQTLQYLFKFLDSYNFSSDSSAKIQKENKSVINASVLGLIFEKINGYKDGAVFTPSFITMYMCKETIHKIVIQKFNETNNWNCQTIEDVRGQIDYKIEEERIKANAIINSIKLCDIAVGSGHFLVSALNAIIEVKWFLSILSYKNNDRVKSFKIEIENDELIITDEEHDTPFQYRLNQNGKPIQELQDLQEALFYEKQTIIENCLFGVDINPKSVMICRLRLWIELLKNSYYTKESKYELLETLPNIDINIKCGNSLISRFSIDANLRDVLKKSDYSIQEYRKAVDTYRNAKSKDEKRKMEELISLIKSDFKSEISRNDPKVKRLKKLKDDLLLLTTQTTLFEKTKKEKTEWSNKVNQLNIEIGSLDKEIQEIKSNKIYDNAFEWRFEFPEVLNENGDFVGFDLVITNPPYGADIKEDEKELFKKRFVEYHTRWTDTFNYFIPLGFELCRESGIGSFIIPNNFLFQNEYEKARIKLIESHQLLFSFNLGDEVFKDANVPTAIIIANCKPNTNYSFNYSDLRGSQKDLSLFVKSESYKIDKIGLLNSISKVIGVSDKTSSIIEKISRNSCKIDDITIEVANGIQPTGDKIFRINNEIAEANLIEKEILKKVLVGGDFTKYSIPSSSNFVIYTIKNTIQTEIPNTIKYLTKFKSQLSQKRETKKGTLPFWCLHWARYVGLFEKEKIVIRQTSDKIIATYDNDNYYAMNNVIILQLKEDSLLNYKYVLSVLNSSVINYIYQNITQEKSRAFAEVKPINIRKLPIKGISKECQKPFIDLVDKILAAKKINDNTSTMEEEIDQMVYKLYDLTPDEIEIVEATK